jgi:rhamnosyl/mannosyltransferase
MNKPLQLSRHKRVLQVGKYYPPYFGGIESHIHTLCSELRKYIDVRVLVANTERHDCEEVFGTVPVTRAGTVMRLAGAPVCLSMARKIRASQADLVHIHMPNPTAAISYLASGFNGPLILTWHSDVVRQRVLKALFSPVERKLLGHARAIIASSPDNLAYSPALYRHRARCRVIPYGIPAPSADGLDRTLIAKIHRLYGRPLLLSVGRMVPYKGYRYLVQAMKQIKASLVLIGDGPERARLEQEVRAGGLTERIHFLGAVEDTTPYYHSCDVFVLPSITRNETFGLVQLEAMACGKPVVNTQLRSGAPFVSVNGFTGMTVPPADSDALAHAITVLLEDPERRSAYAIAAQERVVREFSLDKMVSQTLQLYQQILDADQTNHYPDEDHAVAAD